MPGDHDADHGLAGLERAARDCLAMALDDEVEPADIGMDSDMVREYGLTSLNKVLLMTSLCERTDISVSHFTEHDLAGFESLRDIVNGLARHANLVGEGSPR